MAARKKNKLNKNQNRRNKIPSKPCCIKGLIILLVLLIFSLGIFWFFWNQTTQSLNLVDYSGQQAKLSPAPQITRVRSSDGTMTLVMKTENLTPEGKNYAFIAINNVNQNEQMLFDKIVDSKSTVIIPVNSWSPDNKSAFIKESGLNNLTFLVFKASGENYAGGEKYYDIGALFAKKIPKYTLVDATGWASETLIIIKTNTDQGTKGPSFWFDLTSQSFLQLSR